MTDYLAKALFELGVKEYVLRGIPENESQYRRMFRKIIGKTSNGTGIESDDHTKFGATWTELTAKMDELKAAEPMRLLRLERDRLISETDWWASSDLTITDAQKKYRQDLRDITKTASPKITGDGPSTALDMSSVTWPTKP